MRRIKAGLAAAVIAAALAGGWWFLTQRPLAVAVLRPENDVPIVVFGLGTVEARVLSKVGFRVPGTLLELAADVGDTVAKGTVLARIDGREQRARVVMAEAAEDRARADLQSAQSKLTRSRAVLAQARQVNERRQTLLRQAAVSEEAAQDAAAALAIAAAEIEVAQADIAVRQAALRDADAQRSLQAVILDQHTLTAPYDAVVVDRHREAGAVVGSGEAVLTLADPDSIWIRAFVDEAAAGGLAVGQTAAVRLRSLPGKSFRATVARIDLESDRVSEERRVHLRCQDCPAQLYLGEQAEVLVETARLAQALLVPQAMVEEYAGESGLVWTVEDGRLNRRRVQFGQRTLDGRLEIAGGLPPGARVLAELPLRARPGRLAEVRP